MRTPCYGGGEWAKLRWEARTAPNAGLRWQGRGQGILFGWGVVVSDVFAAERSRWALWLPVWFGAGIAIYFLLSEEPAWWAGPTALIAALAAAAGTRRRIALHIAAWCMVVVASGFSIAQFRTGWVAAPVLEKRTGSLRIEARVIRVEIFPKARRVWLDRLNISRLAPAATPERIRVRMGKGGPELRPGDLVGLRAVLYPPPGPAAPGAFDFSRRAYFQRLGGVGYAVSKVRRIGPGEGSFALAVEGLRHGIAGRVRDALPGEAGTIAAALMTGKRGAIPESVLGAMRDSGLAHLLAISGLHVGLVGGIVFFSVRLLLACRERLTLRHSIKKWAAVAAMVGAFGYLLLSGATVPTQRAFLMLFLVLAAIVLDRLPISMRLVAWAAGAVLLIAPESLLSVSFQMSFAAVVALVAVYEAGTVGTNSVLRDRIPRPLIYLGGVVLTTLVAGLATAPFAIYHFNRVALYGVAANLIAIPLTGMWIMPWAVAAFVLLPLGLEHVALTPMGWGIEGLVAVAKFIQALPGSVALLPAMPPYSLALVGLGGLWLCLWQRRWRYLGVVPAVAGMLTLLLVRPPDILVDGAAKVMAVRAGDGSLLLTSSRAPNFGTRIWLRRMGQAEHTARPRRVNGAADALRCDGIGCIYRAAGHTVALVKHRAALGEDCAVATVLISRVPIRPYACRRPLAVIDRFKLWREGPHALWLTPGAVRMESVRRSTGRRPWTAWPGRGRKRR